MQQSCGATVAAGRSPGPPIVLRILLAAASGALLTLAFPDADQGWLAWVALVPLMFARQAASPAASAGLGFITGLVAAFGLYHWVLGVGAFRFHHGLALGAYLSLYPAAWCAGLAYLERARLPMLATAPALWIVLDYMRAHAGFLAVSWTTLAQSQHENLPILQMASVAGEYGVTFLVLMGNVAVFHLLRHQALTSALAVVFAVGIIYGAGAVALGVRESGSALTIAVVQPSILISERRTAAGRAASLRRLERLTRAATPEADLIVWPETALREPMNDARVRSRVTRLIDSVDTPVLFGASEVFKLTSSTPDGLTIRNEIYNSAYLGWPGRALSEPYRKMRLLPFGEYTPLRGRVTWPQWLVPEILELTPGTKQRLFHLQSGVPLAVLICWENLFADLSRQAVRDGARLLVQITNNNWFGRSAQPRQHNLASVLRAVETGVPVVIASNSGPSAVIDARGRVIAELPTLFESGVVSAEVTLAGRETLYSRLGDVFVALAALLLVGAGLSGARVLSLSE